MPPFDQGGSRQDADSGPARGGRSVSPQQAAWDAYDGHKRGCVQCQTSVWRCDEGDELWRAVTGG